MLREEAQQTRQILLEITEDHPRTVIQRDRDLCHQSVLTLTAQRLLTLILLFILIPLWSRRHSERGLTHACSSPKMEAGQYLRMILGVWLLLLLLLLPRFIKTRSKLRFRLRLLGSLALSSRLDLLHPLPRRSLLALTYLGGHLLALSCDPRTRQRYICA